MAKNDVVVKITQKQVAGSAGFGVPLIVQGMAAAAKEYAEYGSLDAVMEAGITQDGPIYKQCAKLFIQNNRPEMVGICAGTGKVTETLNLIKEKDFRQVIPVFGENDDTPEELAAYIEASGDKMLFMRAVDVAELASIGKMDRTMMIMYTGEEEGVEGALVGATSGLAAGSFTYKNMVLKGIAPDPLTDTQIEAVHRAGGICIVKKAGEVVTSEGMVASGEYTDVIDSRDYVVKNIAYKSQKLLNSAPKLSFDNVGISQLEGVVTTALKEAAALGMIAIGDDGVPIYSTDFAAREGTSDEDRAGRTYNGGRFSFELAGAIHYAAVTGTIEV